MKHFALNFSLTILCCAVGLFSSAAELIYPQSNPYRTSSSVSYIAGAVKKGSSLKINGNSVKVYPNGGFCFPVSLNFGENTFSYEEISADGVQKDVVKIIRNSPSGKKALNPPVYKAFPSVAQAVVTTDGAPLRNGCSSNGARLSHLPEGTFLFVEGEQNNFLKLAIKDGSNSFWIKKSDAKILYDVGNAPKAKVSDIDFSTDDKFDYIKIKTDFPVPFRIIEHGNALETTLYGTSLPDFVKTENLSANFSSDGFSNLKFSVCANGVLWGYEGLYEKNTFVLKIRKPPKVNKNCPLREIVVALDPGHGGHEKGTVGLTKIPEKTVNLDIAQRLKTLLENSGATVVMTRNHDKYTGLYERPAIAKKHDALILLSIHANSVVDQNPLIKHGTSSFYYHPQAKDLATIIRDNAVKDLNLKDDGCRFASFVLTRESNPISVLFETAYMPNPDEYTALLSPEFRQKTALSLKKSLEEYLLKYGVLY